MKPCKSIACGNNAEPGSAWCAACDDQRLDLDDPKNQPKPTDWWAVFLVVAVIAACAVLTWSGHR